MVRQLLIRQARVIRQAWASRSAVLVATFYGAILAGPVSALTIPANTWVQQPPPAQMLPSGRAGSYEARGWNHMRYDAAARQFLIYDGYLEPPKYPLNNIYANSLWLYDPVGNRLTLEKLSHWTRVNGATVPLPENYNDPTPFDRHSYSCIVYCASKNTAYLWSGANNSISTGYIGDMWAYDFSKRAWREITGSHPFTVFEQSMSYDPFLNKLILVGGSPATYRDGTNTYLFDLNTETWTDATPATSPTARFGQTLCFDPVQRVTWMFGGGPYGSGTDELWQYDAARDAWEQIQPEGASPSARRFAHMAYDSKHAVMLLWGGVTSSNEPLGDTWIFDPAARSWRQVTPDASPPANPRDYSEDLDYDSGNDVFVLNRGGTFWLYRYATEAEPPATAEVIPAFGFRLLSSNPTRRDTEFEFTLPHEAEVRVDVLSVTGRRVATLIHGRYPAGTHTASWSRRLIGGSASGVYYLRLRSDGRVVTRRIVRIR
jgi:hypothetical protein